MRRLAEVKPLPNLAKIHLFGLYQAPTKTFIGFAPLWSYAWLLPRRRVFDTWSDELETASIFEVPFSFVRSKAYSHTIAVPLVGLEIAVDRFLRRDI